MKLSINWLQEFVDTKSMSTEQISNNLTMSGTKVEKIENKYKNISNVVIGKILNISKHPNADKLVICKVLVNKDAEPLQIVTGAKNIKENDIVPVALNNSILQNGQKIKSGKLRGVESQGMLCSLSELGLSKNDFPYAVEDGIFIVEEKCEIGDDIKKVLCLESDILELEITSNRPDCLSVKGVARELASTIGEKITEDKVISSQNETNISDIIDVKVNSKDLCNRYIVKHIKNVKITRSPLWIRTRLRECGIKPVNNIVDITNYVMLETGQPLHAFDYKKLSGKQIVVRQAKENEKIVALNDKTYHLDETNLVISDENNPIAIAGIIGGLDCSVSEETTEVILESASFCGENVRNTSKSLDIRTESSLRFEKNLNPESAMMAMQKACELIYKTQAGEFLSATTDIYNNIRENEKIAIDFSFINKFLGTDIPKSEMIRILQNLDFKIDKNIVTVPSFRIDVQTKFDIAEEIARIYGYNNIPSTNLTGKSDASIPEEVRFIKDIKQKMFSLGCNEIITYSFIGPKNYKKLNLNPESEDMIKIVNPIGQDTSIMRTSLIPTMVETIFKNINNGNSKSNLFEIGKEYKKTSDNKISEFNKLCIGIYGAEVDFFFIKGIVQTLIESMLIGEYDVEKESSNPLFHPGRCCVIKKSDDIISTIGQIHPIISENNSINKEVYIADIDIETLYKHRTKIKKYTPISKFPSCKRDLSLICDKKYPIIYLYKQIESSMGEFLSDIELIDIYEGDQIESDKKSVCYSISIKNQNGTLTDEQANEIIENILEKLKESNIYIRK